MKNKTKNNYLRYLSEKRFRDAVNQLVDPFTDLILSDEQDEYTNEDCRAVANEALQFVFEGNALLDDEEAAKHLRGTKRFCGSILSVSS